MGRVSIGDIVTALNDAGIPAEHGFPAEKMAAIAKPVAAVSLLGAALREQTMTVLVTILSPAESGGAVCEDTALTVGEILSALDSDCTIGECQFDGKAGLFYTKIKADFLTEIPKVKINDTLLEYVEAFTCWRTVDEEAGITELSKALWNFRLEEFFPTGASENQDEEEPFVLMHISQNGSETYSDCKWTYHKRVWGSTGVRQIRLGTAVDMQNG